MQMQHTYLDFAHSFQTQFFSLIFLQATFWWGTSVENFAYILIVRRYKVKCFALVPVIKKTHPIFYVRPPPILSTYFSQIPGYVVAALNSS